MKLLIITQKVDKDDPVLGFFHGWIEEFAKEFESIIVVCLGRGVYNLPPNVRVLSLGKDRFKIQDSRFKLGRRFLYLSRFYGLIWKERKNYDAVFVHMNQEYVLLGGDIWKVIGKPIYMWRNHHAGSLFTDLAALLCRKIFYTSRFSYTAKYKKALQMPVGIDTERFSPDAPMERGGRGSDREARRRSERIRNSILFLGRMDSVKRPDLLLRVLKILSDKKVDFSASLYGDPSVGQEAYYDTLRAYILENTLSQKVSLHKGVSNRETPKIYGSHEIFVNLSPSGMYDKTIFEAAACGCLSLSSNKNLIGKVDPALTFKEGNVEDLADKIERLLSMKEDDKTRIRRQLTGLVSGEHSLRALGHALREAI